MGSTQSRVRSRGGVTQPRLGVGEKAQKIILLGTSDSGKSTILKQMETLARGEVHSEDRSSWVGAIAQNVRESIQHILQCMEARGVWFHDATMAAHARSVLDMNVDEINMHSAQTIRLVWLDSLTQHFVESHRAEALLYPGSEQFLDKVEYIGRVDYRPTDEDILLCRRISMGISVWNGQLGSTCIEVHDVAGAKAERRKWARCYDNASVILYCASLTDYDKKLREDKKTSRLDDSLDVFEEIVNSPRLQNAQIALLLTKSDLMAERLSQVPLQKFCSDFDAAPTAENAIQYIRDRYMDRRNNSTTRKINTFVLNATDIHQVERALHYMPGISGFEPV